VTTTLGTIVDGSDDWQQTNIEFQWATSCPSGCLGDTTGTCLNGGTCVDEVDSFLCNCLEDYDGLICENWIEPTFSTGSATPIVSEISTVNLESGEAFTTFQLFLSLSSAEANVHSLYAFPDSPAMTFPAAFQTALGGDIGVTPVIAEFDAYDSYLTIGNSSQGLTAVGTDFPSWSTDDIAVTDGGLFFPDPSNAPSGVVLIAQLTVPCDSTFMARVNAQGLNADQSVNAAWRQENIEFSFTSGLCCADACFRNATDVSASVTSIPVSQYPAVNSFVAVDIYLHLSDGEQSVTNVSVNTDVSDAVVAVPDEFIALPDVLVATVEIPTSRYEYGSVVELTIAAEGTSVYEFVGSGLDWQQQIVVDVTMPQAAGCPFDCRDNNGGSSALGWDGQILLSDLLALLSQYGTCFDPSDTESSNCHAEGWVGYPYDGSPDNGDGTYGDGVVNVHDLLDVLGNYHRDYIEFPCVFPPPPPAPAPEPAPACEDNNALVSSFQPFLSNSGGLDCATIIGPPTIWTCDYDTAGTVCNGPPATGPLGSCPDIAGPLSTYCPLTCGAC